MYPLIYQRVATMAVMPLAAAGGWYGYHHYQQPYQQPGYYQNTYGQLSVTGIDGPTQLGIGQTGNWSMHVAGWNPSSGGVLHYQITWGDENQGVRSAAAAYPAPTVVSTGSFTHVYIAPGTYRPTFYVTDDYGHTTQASLTIIVGSQSPVYNPGYGGYGNTYGNSSYCSTYAGWYDRSCHGNQYNSGYGNTYDPYGSSYGSSYGSNYGNNYNYNPYGGGYGNTYGNSSYCSTYAGWYDRSCHGNQYNSGYGYGNTYGSQYGSGYGGYGSGYPSGCTSYYDRSCYDSSGQYIGPDFQGTGYTYNGPGGSVYNNYPYGSGW